MKKTIKTFLLLPLALVSSFAHADYKYRQIGLQYGIGANLLNQPQAVAPLPLAQGDAMQYFSDSVYSAVRNGYIVALQQLLPNAPDYRGHTPYISGNLKMQIGPGANGYASLALTGQNFGFSLYQKPHSGPIPANCTTDVTLNNVVLQSNQVNLTVGSVQNLTLTSTTPTTHFSCSTSLSWIPGLGNLLDAQATQAFAAQASARINDMLTNSAGFQIRGASFAGLDTVLPVGSLVIAGQDVGAYVRNNLAYLVMSGAEVTINPVPAIPSGGGGGYINDSWTVMSVRFSNGTTVTITGTRSFEPYWDSNCGGRDGSLTCDEP